MEGLTIKELNIYKDHRGWLSEIIRSDESEFKPLMAYISMTRSGLVRGPHEHSEQTDYFCVIGKFRLYFWDNRKTSPTYKEHKIRDTSDIPTIVIIPPGIVHAYKNLDNADGLVLNLPDKLYKGWEKKDTVDEIRYEDDLNSPFQIKE
jgi:dTDP-4-dehydrorhamnose 3,5-epimerase